ncbi:hypothetical protein MHB42_10500 [Lysinibacillus sp. FSL K6-0232]
MDIRFPKDWQTTSYYPISEEEGIMLERKSIKIDWIEQYTLAVLKIHY